MRVGPFPPRPRPVLISLASLLIGATPVVLGFADVEAATYTVTNTNDSGTSSLRWAITMANGNLGTDNIAFSIAGTGPHTIQPFSALPTITEPVIIDGFTQPGATPNTNPIDQPCNAVLKIELDGTYAGSGADGIRIAAGSSTVRGLVINRFDRVGVRLDTNGSNVVEGCIIGMDPTGTISLGNNDGMEVTSGANNNTIGGTTPAARNVISGYNIYGVQMIDGASGNAVLGNFIGTDITGTLDRGNQWAGVYLWTNAANNTVGGTATGARNVISGNDWYGVRIQDAGSGNVVLGNYIGTDRTGTNPLGNAWSGVRLEETANNTVGGTAPGAGNVIAANGWSGIGISDVGSTGNRVLGNHIGTDATGADTLGNADNGVRIYDGASNNTIGGTTAGARNVIAGNYDFGVEIDGGGGPATGNVVQGNFIGTDATGTQALGNLVGGVDIWIASGNTIGGIVTSARNVISGNGGDAVHIDGDEGPAEHNVVCGNYIGTDVTGTQVVGNGWGVWIEAASNNTIGGTMAGAGNVISGNSSDGVGIIGEQSTVTGNLVQGNLIGTDASGTVALGNGNHGVFIEYASQTTVGGAMWGARNVISGNASCGIALGESTTSCNVIQGNYIGTETTGSGALGNGEAGVKISGAWSNTIGGTGAGEGNLISGNGEYGVHISDSTSTGNVIQGNYIGTDSTGTIALGNLDGIRIHYNAGRNTVGGTTPGARNIISGNSQFGLTLAHSAGNVVQGNYIGTDVTGTVALGIQWEGVSLWAAPSNTVGGASSSARNVVSGNDGCGFHIAAGADSNVIAGNYIGVDVSGTAALGNAWQGVYILDANCNTIGGTGAGEGNVIAYSGDDGISVQSGIRNAFLGNAVFSNDSLGIDLDPSGVTPNDPADPDVGANDLQNYPILTLATCSGTNSNIEGTLNSTPNTAFRLEFFSNSVADPSGYGEGETYLGSTNVLTNGAGDASFDVTLHVSVPGGHRVTATATDPNNNTSEFSEWAFVMTAAGSLVGGELQITWPPFTRTAEYWVYGAMNDTYFEPQLTSPYQYRITTLPGTATTWSTTNGVADPDSNWTYVIVAVDIAGQELVRSNACGDHDFEADAGP